MKTINWKSMTTAPFNTVVLLTGKSGIIKPNNKYVILGYRQKEYHRGDWNDIRGDSVTDQFGEPTYWADKPFLP